MSEQSEAGETKKPRADETGDSSDSEAESEAASVSDSEVDSEAESEAASVSDSESESEAESEGSDSEVESEAESESESDSKSEAACESDSDSASGSESESAAESQLEAESDAASEASSGSASASESDAEAEPTASEAASAASESSASPEAESKSESESESASTLYVAVQLFWSLSFAALFLWEMTPALAGRDAFVSRMGDATTRIAVQLALVGGAAVIWIALTLRLRDQTPIIAGHRRLHHTLMPLALALFGLHVWLVWLPLLHTSDVSYVYENLRATLPSHLMVGIYVVGLAAFSVMLEQALLVAAATSVVRRAATMRWVRVGSAAAAIGFFVVSTNAFSAFATGRGVLWQAQDSQEQTPAQAEAQPEGQPEARPPETDSEPPEPAR